MMNRWRRTFFAASLILVSAGCTHKPGAVAALKPTGFGAALVESSGQGTSRCSFLRRSCGSDDRRIRPALGTEEALHP